MCDYSLHGLPSRLAVEGEPLVVHRFPTATLGLASPTDVQAPAAGPPAQSPAGFWSRLKSWFSISDEPLFPAVCVPPGARLLLRDIPQRLQQQLGAGAEEEVIFIQLSAEAYCYRDAVRFNNGREILLQKLEEGQRVDVLCLSSGDEAPQRLQPVAAVR